MAHAPNVQLIPGVSKLSRSQVYAKKALYKKKKVVIAAKTEAKAATKTVTVGGAKNGQTRVVPVEKASRFYAAEDAPQPKVSRKTVKTGALRQSITPGTVLIVLSGRFRGKRVVFLKRLDSGLLLVTGPHKANGVPLRRVNQAYVIGTSTKVDVSKVNVDKFDDAYFKKPKAAKAKATEEALFNAAERKPVDAHRIADQKEVDAAVSAAIKKVPALRGYLRSSFALSKGQFPHLLKF
ncbi:ribosomal protein L6e-domain-containing protein [Polychytrium aggregatum]|uniref:ribosomal protein L6e-domain-containing protein n=1 Tax=Polychytrium aggregatum TaxID=110093 RepID=UPI0022FDF89C|nr:ribosomal protein L6e-domain-containing protein [Polychytrium aggregatum]KAI9207859.1 ribosomal protein L6e-domain-containing protein [Polychytrium aggregatum]